MHLSTTSLLLLPLLASSSFALPSPRRHARGLFRRIREREYAGTGVYANFVADVADVPSADPSSSASSSDTSTSAGSDPSPSSSYIIAVASASPAEDYLPASSVGKDTVQPSTVDLSSQSLSSLLAQTTAYNSFSYTDYVASSTSAPAALATQGSGDVYAEAISAAEAYVKSMMQNVMPTITLEIVMEPTQVSRS
jgi:hypothetical protein